MFFEKLLAKSFYFHLKIGARWIFDLFEIAQRCWNDQENVEHSDTISKNVSFSPDDHSIL